MLKLSGKLKEENCGMADNIEKEIISIISDVSGFDAEEIKLDSKLAEELEIDSIKAIEITVAIEKKFKISVRDEDVPNIMTVKQAVELVNSLLDKKRMNA
jgi:acyl carrier protein